MSHAWEEFVAAHGRLVLSAALRVLGHEADAEDVAQDVFVEIFRSNRRDDFATQPALITTVATRRALDRLRRRRATAPLDAVRETSGRGVDPADQVVADELLARLRRDVATLPPREAEVFCLVAFEQMSQSAVARLLNISVGAVAKALCKARQSLARALAESDARSNP